MKCPNCNSDLTGTEDICPSCGTSLKQTFSSRISQKVDNAIGEGGVAPASARLQTINNKVMIAFLSILLVVEIVVFTIAMQHGLPFYIPLIFFLFTLVGIVVAIRSNKKIAQIDFKEPARNYEQQMKQSVYKSVTAVKPGTNLFGTEKISLGQGESVITYLTPIYRLQSNFTGMSQVSAERFTENVIAVTERRVLFFTAALPGQGMLIGGASQDFLNDELKRNTLKQMVANEIDQLKSGNSIDHFPNDFWIERESLEQVQYLKGLGPVKYLYAGALGFIPKGGKKLKYQVVDSTNFDQIIELFNAKKKMAI